MPRGKDAHVRLGEHDGHIPGVYVAWKIILILLFTLLLGWVVKEIHTFISYSKSRAKPIVTMQFFKLLLLLVATILRWVWLLDPHQTSKVWPAPLFGKDEATWNVVTTPLIITPQIIFFIIIVLEIQQWRLVVNSSDRLRSIRKQRGKQVARAAADDYGLHYFPVVLYFCLRHGMLFCGWRGAVEVCADTWVIYSVTFIIYMVCFGLCGLYYAIKLGRLIYTLRSYKLKKADFDAGKTVSQKQKALNKLRRVQRTVIVLTFCGHSCDWLLRIPCL